MRRNARQIAEVLGAQGVDEDEVPGSGRGPEGIGDYPVKGLDSTGTEVGLPLIDDVVRFQVLGDYGCGAFARWLSVSHHPAQDTGGEAEIVVTEVVETKGGR